MFIRKNKRKTDLNLGRVHDENREEKNCHSNRRIIRYGPGNAVIQLADRFAGLEEIWVIARRGRRLDKLAGKVPVPLRVLELDLQEELVFAELEEKLEWEDPEVKILVNGAGFGKIGCTEDCNCDRRNWA